MNPSKYQVNLKNHQNYKRKVCVMWKLKQNLLEIIFEAP